MRVEENTIVWNKLLHENPCKVVNAWLVVVREVLMLDDPPAAYH